MMFFAGEANLTQIPTLVGVRANQPTFREVTFTAGFNVVLAERTKESTKKDSRNGLGKSTLVDIISYCLGGKAHKDGLGCDALIDWSFTLDMHLRGVFFSITRSMKDPAKVTIEGDTTGWPIPPRTDKKSGMPIMKTTDWAGLLGTLMFGLPPGGFDTDYSPTFRSLISYFVRREKDSYSIAFEHFRKQKEWDKQVNNAFLLGIAWQDASEWQKLRDKKASLEELRKAQKAGLISEFMSGSLGELEALRVRLETVVRQGERSLMSFKVLEQYHDLEERADRLSKEINSTANRIVADRQLLGNYQAGLDDIPEPNVDDVVSVYEEAGVFFPSTSRRQLEDVKEFHRKLIENRRRFLSSEITRLRQAIERSELAQRRLDDERASVMQVLQSHGALDQLLQLQRIHSESVAQLRAVESQIETMRKIEEGKSNLRIEEELLRKKTRNDLDDRMPQRGEAIKLFNENSEALYESPGNLVIDVASAGFKFDIEIKRSRSGGFGNMKILCYDLMLVELWAVRNPSPRLLVHDSIIFADVDERQVANGLVLAERKSRECGFQYICTFNSDAIPREDLPEGFDLERYTRLTLTDKDPSGGLLGIRF